jgi:hypothetical protein
MNKSILLISLLFNLICCSKNRELESSINPLKSFAIEYNPCLEPENECHSLFGLPVVPDNVSKVLEDIEIDELLINYNTLIMLKLYRAQLERAHQSYDIRNNTTRFHPVLKVFTKYSGIEIKGEFVSSDISYKWIKKQNDYRNNPLISEEMKRIEIIRKTLSNN